MNARTVLWLSIGGIVIAVGLGLIVAQRIMIGPDPTHTADPVRLTDAVLGTPVTTEGSQADILSRLQQRPEYDPAEPIALRVTADIPSGNSAQLSVRLRDAAGAITSLSPGTLTIQNGTSGYCCWVIDEPGDYTLQISRPSGPLSSLPLTIRAGRREPLRIDIGQ